MILVAGCDATYYWQAASGQLQLITERQSIEELVQSERTPPALKSQLQLILDARQFALDRLPITANDSYLSYVDLKREHVIWNLFVTPKLSMENQTWCYPIAGCVSYRGYFSQQKALASAQDWQQKGFDVYVGGVDAYSTLGWFDDPVLSSFLSRPPLGLAALLFHELSHQVLYVKDDTVFNESFATTVEEILLQQWVVHNHLQPTWSDYHTNKARQNAFMEMVIDNKLQRDQLFRSDRPASEKAIGKQRLIADLASQYQQFKAEWDHYSGYDDWFAQGLNNAQLSTIATYYELAPGFHALFQQSNNDLAEFINRCQALAERSKSERDSVLKQLATANIDYTEN